MHDISYSQAKRISGDDPDLEQNILAFNHLKLQSALARGEKLSIGEQVNFMKHRAGELRSGARLPIGHGRYKGKDDVYHPGQYFQKKVEIHHFDYPEECINDGRGSLTFTSSIKNLEADALFEVDIEQFTSMLIPVERKVFLLRIAGYDVDEIADELKINSTTVRIYLRDAVVVFKKWFSIE
jgi:hypothetical protein